MNQLAERTERLPMDSVGMSTGATGAKIAPQNLAEVVKFAEVMCRADIALPKHLRGNAGACMAVALQALDWQMNPFAVASKSYQVNGTIAYEAQLIAAVVNTRSGIKGRLRYSYEGTGTDMTCTVSGTLDGEEYSYTSPPVGLITPKNSPLWKTDQQQQLGYYSARSWARRYTPEVILGVYDREEAEQFQGPDNARDITPQPSVMQRLRQNAAHRPEGEREGFDASFVHSETETAQAGDIFDDDLESGDAPVPPDAAAGSLIPASAEPAGAAPAGSPIPDATETPVADLASGEDPAGGAETAPSQPPAGSRDPETETLIQFARDVLPMAADREATGAALKAIENEWAPKIKALSPDGQAKATSISKSMRAIFNGNTSLESAIDYYADVLGCSVEELGGRANG
ncbi:recombinase RecT [Rhizobium sp. BK456]|uniref:recombinase RecT n=1 Tax=Rhizobium sp. BK456 TaxID=2587007 RepID=UPI0016095E05|nr:recombinase RecT [Rhizobium sp. BK456]MBB3521099.1 hypothetical protein [Rhizobium sp. BK456]